MSLGRRALTASYLYSARLETLLKCEICGVSDKETKIINSSKYGCLCRKHYLRKYKGKNLERSKYDLNEYTLYDSYAEIVLYDKDNLECGRAIIDLDDVEKCKQYKWHMKRDDRTNYVIGRKVIKESKEDYNKIFLHKVITGCYDKDKDVDHINHNGLDNRTSNLRIVTRSENILNQRKICGIKKVPSGKYQVSIGKNYKTIYIGTYDSFEEAYKARKEAELKYA